MDDNVELQAACAALGYLDGDKYYKEPDCLGSQSYCNLFICLVYLSEVTGECAT